MTVRFLTVHSAAPVSIDVQPRITPKAIGITSLCDSNIQRLTAMDPQVVNQVLNATALLSADVQLFGLGLYSDDLPVEAVDIQPYMRPQRGLPCLFAMTGDLPGIEDNQRFPVGEQWPLSCTAQERAFCLLQERVRKLWSEGRPDEEVRLALISDYAGRLNRLAAHSFVHWDGEMLFAYSALEKEHEPIAFIQCDKALTEVDGEVCLRITAEDACSRVIVGSQSLLPPHAEVIGPGSTLCFRQGQLSQRCDPVDFWTNMQE